MRRFGLACARVAAGTVLALLAACTSTPQASNEADLAAKDFHTHPNAATIYVYRSEFNQLEEESILYMDGRLIGATLPGTYFRIDAVPGRHVLHGLGPDVGSMALDARPGQLYFVALDVIAYHSHFKLVPANVGESRVRACCALLENWARGQACRGR